MTTEVWWVLIGTALLLGATVGGLIAFRVLRRRFAAKLRRATDELQRRQVATTEQLRAAQVRAQAELEQTRAAFKRQLATAAAEPLAAVARAEERLRAAYDELDRLRRGTGATETGPLELGDGVAATRPMREGL